ncbi:uncharacterized protein B0H64DRAFT_415966 [Chaetomium fimeti]|uniref:Rhodopsin domain-containing protein n=1 Tax=Chaetomium fimeti TaxID=1854472 RepID=A0AAE0LT65_9PEZI|nr:hypothetical protein B0H64DRAFT_415966 [Chaetomium fimeti]
MNSSFPTGSLSNDLNNGQGAANATFPGFFHGEARLDDLGPTTRISVWLLLGAGFVFLLLRLAICNNIAINLGYGKHVWQIHFQNLNDMYLVGQVTITLTICAAAWSKTSFGITLLMISDGIHGKTRVFIWFALVSMNLLLGTTAMLFWVGCTPLEKAWHPFIRGTCWSPNVLITYNVFTSGEYLDFWPLFCMAEEDTNESISYCSILWGYGPGPCHHPVGDYHESSHAHQGEDCAAASAFIKCSSLPELGGRDFPHDGVTLVIWGSAEAAVTIMAASVPMLRMLVHGTKASGRESRTRTSENRSRRTYNTTGSSRRVYYYNKPRRDLVTMTGSTWTGRSR